MTVLIVAGALVGCMLGAVAGLAVYVGKLKKALEIAENALTESRNNIHELREKLTDLRTNTDKVLSEAAKAMSVTPQKQVTRLNSYSILDNEFLNRIAEVNELPQMQFMIDTIHREIYEAALSTNDERMILNAIGKGKGVRVLERKLSNPQTIFTGEVFENEDEENGTEV